MTTERIDPLAVIRKHAAAHVALATSDAYSTQEAPRLLAAATAVAELVEAAREIREHAQHHPDCDLVANGIDGDCWCGLFGSSERIDAALAAFGRQG